MEIICNVTEINNNGFIEQLKGLKVQRKLLKKDNNDHEEKQDDMQQHKMRGLIYMHCLGGHGRSGLLTSLLLQAIYGMDAEISLKFLNEIHQMRHPWCSADRMPESKEQRDQIERLHPAMIKLHNKLKSE